MKRASLAAVCLLAMGVALGPRDAGAQDANACIRFRGQARYGAYGYNHIVHIANGCPLVADCVVSTDVNPQPQSVTVPPRSEVDVNTFLGSPASVFVPKVVCAMKK